MESTDGETADAESMDTEDQLQRAVNRKAGFGTRLSSRFGSYYLNWPQTHLHF